MKKEVKEYKVSIIVPVYKVEKYLRKCMDSLVNQTLDDIELVCINDGSPDNCLSILKEYQNKFPDKVVIIDKKNEGVWKGRYDGIKKARGKYITFTDSDDYVSLDYAEKLYKNAEKFHSDISICGFYRVDLDTQRVFSKEMNKFEGKIIDMKKNPEALLSINGALWNKLYRAELLKKMDNIENPPRVLDDMMFFLLIAINAKKITFINDCLYYYMVRSDSIMSTVKKDQVISSENAMVAVRNIYKKNNPYLLNVIDALAFLHFGLSLMYRVSYDKDANLDDELKSNKKYLDDNFPTWSKSSYLSLRYCIKHHFMNAKVVIMKKVYTLGLYKSFLKLYKFMINKLKIDIKW